MSLRMVIQDVKIEYYEMMSRIVQSRRKNSPMTSVNFDAIDKLSILEKMKGQILSVPIEKSEYEKKSSVTA